MFACHRLHPQPAGRETKDHVDTVEAGEKTKTEGKALGRVAAGRGSRPTPRGETSFIQQIAVSDDQTNSTQPERGAANKRGKTAVTVLRCRNRIGRKAALYAASGGN